MALMLRMGMLTESGSVFDYGCGQGDDVATLQANGYEAFGWDPHFKQNGERREADLVNLGFVLNVIESVPERVETAAPASRPIGARSKTASSHRAARFSDISRKTIFVRSLKCLSTRGR
jgi:hypothetical protein